MRLRQLPGSRKSWSELQLHSSPTVASRDSIAAAKQETPYLRTKPLSRIRTHPELTDHLRRYTRHNSSSLSTLLGHDGLRRPADHARLRSLILLLTAAKCRGIRRSKAALLLPVCISKQRERGISSRHMLDPGYPLNHPPATRTTAAAPSASPAKTLPSSPATPARRPATTSTRATPQSSSASAAKDLRTRAPRSCSR